MNSIWENEEIVDDILRRFFDEFFEKKNFEGDFIVCLTT